MPKTIAALEIYTAQKTLPEKPSKIELPEASFDAAMAFCTLEHLPRKAHAAVLRRIHRWFKPGGGLLLSLEAGEVEGMVGEWLGLPMYIWVLGRRR